MIRASHLVWGALIMSVGTGLFLVANEVGAREKELNRLHAEIRRTTESIHVLRAEWSFLNDPSRLERLADAHLGLKPVRPDQYVSLSQLPYAPLASAPAPDETPALAAQPTPAPRAKPAPPRTVASRPALPQPTLATLGGGR
ncbi:cell division protein FtsL [Pararhodospirillum oryzae]|uniref:Cell division protein FtsL n=1 Tax=Pararhodospirillum oryzae TaxID=478448 RepID=A0A512H8N5_9PROT|nr:hypothetical protein [Pararhodospirillum oryzae]GEO81817.1 hypothetical protein ROR02_19480 [Pararhodospirillum oryzae]